MSGARSSNGFGVNPISYSEIAAWSALTGADPSAQQVRAIKTMDRAFLSEMSRLSAKG